MNYPFNTTKEKYMQLCQTVTSWKPQIHSYLVDQKKKQDETLQRIANTNSSLLFLQCILAMPGLPENMQKELQGLLSSLQFVNKTADKQLIHAAVEVVNVRMHRMLEDTEILTEEQRNHMDKVINWITDAIKLTVDNGMFIDWSNLQGK